MERHVEEGRVLKACVRQEAQLLTFPSVLWDFFFVIVLFVYLFERSSHVVQVGFKHEAEPGLEFNYSCLYLPRAGISCVYYHAWFWALEGEQATLLVSV